MTHWNFFQWGPCFWRYSKNCTLFEETIKCSGKQFWKLNVSPALKFANKGQWQIFELLKFLDPSSCDSNVQIKRNLFTTELKSVSVEFTWKSEPLILRVERFFLEEKNTLIRLVCDVAVVRIEKFCIAAFLWFETKVRIFTNLLNHQQIAFVNLRAIFGYYKTYSIKSHPLGFCKWG